MTAPALPDWTALPTKQALLDRIDRLDISADAKRVLARFAESTMEVGGRILSIGRRIVAFAFDLLKRFPNTAFGIVVAVVVATLIASIPLLGGLLSGLLAPLMLAVGLTKGALADMQQGAMRSRVDALTAEFQTLTA